MKMKTKEQVIEDLQEKIINTGGRFFRRQELEDKTFGELFDILAPNGLHLSVTDSRSLTTIFEEIEKECEDTWGHQPKSFEPTIGPSGGWEITSEETPKEPFGDPDILYTGMPEDNLVTYPESLGIKLEDSTDIFDDEPVRLSRMYNS